MLSCPFCGFGFRKNEELQFATREHGNLSVYCPQCGALGPLGLNEKGAKDWWNTKEERK